MTQDEISVDCRPADGDAWSCRVTVGDDAGATRHEVRVTRTTLQQLRPAAYGPEQLVRDSFAFLLQHEPRESILASFDLPVIGRYFPEWEREIGRR